MKTTNNRASSLRCPTGRPAAALVARTVLIAWASCSLVACGDSLDEEEPGTLRVVLEPEDTILDGLEPGDGVESIRDGWKVTYDKYLIGIGHIALDYATDRSLTAEDSDAYIVDLTQIPPSGEALWKVGGLQPGRWNFGYELVGAKHDVKRHESTDSEDFNRMVDEDLTYLVVGSLTKEDGQSCPPKDYATDITADAVGENDAKDPCFENPKIDFELAVSAETFFGNCELDGVAGVAITSNTTSTDAVTIHGDHLFFNGFPSGSEGGVIRLAQIWANADLNVDGKIDMQEIQDILIADTSEWDDRYQLGGAPVVNQSGEIETLGDVVRGQLKTQGHLNGEGECEVDGQEHEHEE